VLVGIPFLNGVKLKCSFFLHYRPVLLILATIVILFCDTYRLVVSQSPTKQMEQSLNTAVYVYCVVLTILSDFHTGPSNMFRLFVAFLMVIRTAWSVYYYTFVLPDVRLITVGDQTLGIKTVERNAYCEVLFLLKCQLFSLIKDPSHSRFFLIARQANRHEMFQRFSNRIVNETCSRIFPNNTVNMEMSL